MVEYVGTETKTTANWLKGSNWMVNGKPYDSDRISHLYCPYCFAGWICRLCLARKTTKTMRGIWLMTDEEVWIIAEHGAMLIALFEIRILRVEDEE